MSLPTPAPTVAAAPGAGPLLREWRTRRRRSQMDLALDVGVSTRHLSCVETGRARASAPLLLALAEHLELPLRERNRLLLAGGYAPRYAQHGWAAPEMASVRSALERLLAAHEPYPGVVVDRCWNLVHANAAAQRLLGSVPAALLQPVPNVFRISFHPKGLAAHTANFAVWAQYLLGQLRSLAATHTDAEVQALVQEVQAYPNVAALLNEPAAAADATLPLLLPCVLELPAGRMTLFSTVATLGTPQEVTLQELSIELFYPADDNTRTLLQQGAGANA